MQDLTLKLEESKETISKLVNKYMIDKKIKPSKRNIMVGINNKNEYEQR